MNHQESPDFTGRVGRIEELIEGIERLPDAETRESVRELVQAILDLHGAGMERMLEVVYESGPSGQRIFEALADDELVSSLMLLHDLHPLDLTGRVEKALEKVRPQLDLHGGDVELLGVTDQGVVHLRLEGNCHGCPSSRLTLKYTIEKAIHAAAPDVQAIVVEGEADAAPLLGKNSMPAGFVPMGSIVSSKSGLNGNGHSGNGHNGHAAAS